MQTLTFFGLHLALQKESIKMVLKEELKMCHGNFVVRVWSEALENQ